MLRCGGVKKEFFGFDPHTTNNRMELMAAIQGLLALKEPCEVEITTDSEYVLHGITKWIVTWKRGHWWRKHGSVRNADLWMELDELASLWRNSRTTDSPAAAKPAEFLIRLTPRPAACALFTVQSRAQRTRRARPSPPTFSFV